MLITKGQMLSNTFSRKCCEISLENLHVDRKGEVNGAPPHLPHIKVFAIHQCFGFPPCSVGYFYGCLSIHHKTEECVVWTVSYEAKSWKKNIKIG